MCCVVAAAIAHDGDFEFSWLHPSKSASRHLTITAASLWAGIKMDPLVVVIVQSDIHVRWPLREPSEAPAVGLLLLSV